MILDTTNFAIIHEALNFSKYVPVDKHIINQHIFHKGLTVEIDENFLPRYGFTNFEEYAPNLNNLEEVLKSLQFVGRKHYDRLISFVTLTVMRSGNDEEIVKGLNYFVDYMRRTYGERHACSIYAEEMLQHKERFIKHCSENRENYFAVAENVSEDYREFYNNLKNTYGHVVVNRPTIPLNDYIDMLPYTSDHDIVFDFFRKTYTSAHAASRDNLCNHLSLYGWTSSKDNPASIVPNTRRGVVDVPATAQLRKFEHFVNNLINTELEKTRENLNGKNEKTVYQEKYNENLKIYGEKYLFTVLYANLIR